jgi:hypothetical protein
MVFIHPVILRDSDVAAQYTNSKYDYMRGLQRMQDAEGVNLLPGKRHPVLPGIDSYGKPQAPVAPRVDEAVEQGEATGQAGETGQEPARTVFTTDE